MENLETTLGIFEKAFKACRKIQEKSVSDVKIENYLLSSQSPERTL